LAQDRSAPRHDAGAPTRARCEKLRALAFWYREFAERAGNPDVWEARLRTAEDLEAEAARVEAAFANAASAAPASADALRAEARRLLGEVRNTPDGETKRQLTEHALALAQRAEALAVWREEPAIIAFNIERYQVMLKDGIDDASQRRLVEDMLADAEAALAIRRLAAS
jgi:ElaB/YqjD/DUF883 family membrane-anchored ribosome-binding protein